MYRYSTKYASEFLISNNDTYILITYNILVYRCLEKKTIYVFSNLIITQD